MDTGTAYGRPAPSYRAELTLVDSAAHLAALA